MLYSPSRWGHSPVDSSSIPQVLGGFGHLVGSLEAYSDWVISPPPIVGVLMSLPCICTVFPEFGSIFYHWLPPSYNTEIGHHVFDRIELTLYHKWIQQLLYTWYMQNAVFPLFPVLCTSSTASPKHNLWQLIQNWWPNNLQGAYIQVHETCH